MHAVNEVLDHFLSGLEIGDNAVFQRTLGVDLGGGASEHELCFVAESERHHDAAHVFHRDDGGLVEHDPPALYVDERVGRTEVDGHVGGSETKYFVEHRPSYFLALATAEKTFSR